MAPVVVAYVSGAVLYEKDFPELNLSVADLKSKLEPICGVPPQDQIIALESEVLDDCIALRSLPNDEAVLRLTLIRSLTRMVLSGGRDRKLILWDLHSSEADRDLHGHTESVSCLCVNWPQERALSGSADRSIQLWDLANCRCLLELRGHTDAVTCLAVHWESNVAISAGLDQTLLLWDLDGGEVMKELMDHASPTVSLEVDWTGRQALAVSADGAMRLWDLRQDSAEHGTHGGFSGEVQHLFVNWSCLQALVGCSDGSILLWDLSPFQVLQSCVAGMPATCMSAKLDLSEVALASPDGLLYLWSCYQTKETQTPDKAFEVGCVKCLEVDWSGRSALTFGAFGEDGEVKFWNLTMGQCLRVLGHSCGLVSSICVNWPLALAVTVAGRSVKLWDLCRGRCLQTLDLGRLATLAVDWQKHRLLAAGEDSILRLRETFRRGRCIGSLQGHMDTILCVAVDWAGSQALSGGSDRRLILWDLAEWKVQKTLRGHDDAVRCVEVDWKQRRAISGSFDRSIIAWDLDTGEAAARFCGHSDWVCCIAMAWTAGHCISGARDGTLRLWDVPTASCSLTMDGHTGAVWTVAMSFPDAFSSGQDGLVRRWSLQDSCCLQEFQAHQDAVRCMEVDWQSQQLLTGSFDLSLRLWPIDSQDYIQEFEGHKRGVTSCSVDWSSGLAVSGSEDCSIRLWDLFAEDDSGDLLLGGHDGAVLCISMGCGPSIRPRKGSKEIAPAWEEQVMRTMAGRVVF